MDIGEKSGSKGTHHQVYIYKRYCGDRRLENIDNVDIPWLLYKEHIVKFCEMKIEKVNLFYFSFFYFILFYHFISGTIEQHEILD